MQRIIITGAPGTGKTSILNKLQQKGFSVFEEVARAAIKEELLVNSDVLPWKNLNAFSKKVLPLQISNHQKAINGLNFYDRGIPDIAAYQKKSNEDIFEELEKAIQEYRYHSTVFITPPWPEIYAIDDERKERFEEAMLIHEYLVKYYTKYNYQLIEIPKLSVEERVIFLLKSVEAQF